MNRPLRILTIGHSYSIGMNRATMRCVAKDPAFEVTVVAPISFKGDLRHVFIDPEPADSTIRVVGVPVLDLGVRHLMRYDTSALQHLIRNEHFDIVHVWEEPYVYAGYQISQMARTAGTRYCFWTFQNKAKHYPPPFNYFERKSVSNCHSWIAGGQLVYQTMLKKRFPETTGRVIPLAVDTEQFRPLDEDERHLVRDELKLDGTVIGYVGRLTESKGLDVMMQALSATKNRDWSLLVLGSGPYEAKLRSWAAEQKINLRIILAEHSEVPRLMGAMDLLLAPSQTRRNWKEQFGRMLVEAFASGVPVIASDSGEIPFVVGQAGKILSETDVDAWTQAIEQLLEDSALRTTMKARGFQQVIPFMVDSVANEF
ncbi:MAG: glycosyltransferase family 4 protein, partial [Planctomycetales bacterium]|nr:glycosyltransferase family 4 protein [Planctomycetales bacterium]